MTGASFSGARAISAAGRSVALSDKINVESFVVIVARKCRPKAASVLAAMSTSKKIVQENCRRRRKENHTSHCEWHEINERRIESESGRGQPHSKTLRAFRRACEFR